MDLSSLESLYTNTEAKKTGDFEALPDGKYQVAIDNVDLKETSTKKPMLAWQLKVLAGPHKGRKLFKNSVITAESMSYLKQDLTLVGWTQSLTALSDPLARRVMLDVALEVTQKTKGDDAMGRPNVNVYFNRKLDAVIASPNGADVPF